MRSIIGTRTRLFTVQCDNRKRQLGGQLHKIECEGTCYSNGLVHLNTLALPQREFETMRDLRLFLRDYGDYQITFDGEEQPA